MNGFQQKMHKMQKKDEIYSEFAYRLFSFD